MKSLCAGHPWLSIGPALKGGLYTQLDSIGEK